MDPLLEIAERVTAEVVAPQAEAVDRDARWPGEGIAALLDEFGGLVVPESAGGLGQGLAAVARLGEIVGRACPSTALCLGMHHVAAAVIAAKATAGQARDYLGPIAEGSHLTTLALSEPGTGASFWLPETTLRAKDDGFVTTGTKTFVTSGGHADSYVVSTVATDADAPPGQFSCVMVTAETRGLSWGEPWAGLGMRGNASRSMVLDDVWVPSTALLGKKGDQIWYVFNVVAPFFLVAMAGTYLGVADQALQIGIGHLEERRHSHTGRSLATNPVLQHRLGDLWTAVQATRRLLYWACEEGDRGGDQALPALCAAKADVARVVVEVVNGVMTLCGGQGYREDAELGRALRNARAADIMSPTTDVLKKWIGRAVLGRNVLAE